MQKILAACGVGARRRIEEMLEQGRVTKNGKIINLGARAGARDKLCVDGKLIPRLKAEPQLLLYHKPKGEIVERIAGRGDIPTVFDNLPPVSHGRWLNVGRLDIGTEGLLLFSTDGDWVNSIAHPSRQQEREYRVRAGGALEQDSIKDIVNNGIYLDGHQIRPKKFTLDRKGEGANSWYTLILQEGRNRVVRRLFEKFGLQVSRLLRVRFGPYTLPADLPPGQWRRAAFIQIDKTDKRSTRHR